MGPFTPSDNSAMMLVILFLLKTMESLQNVVAIHFWVIPLFSMKTEFLASSQSCRSIDADAWYKGGLNLLVTQINELHNSQS